MANLEINITFDSHFGSEGTGNGEFSFPTGITLLNNEVFVVDRQNHRVQVFNLAGVYQRQFGTLGTGNTNFSFPEGITNDGTDLYIVDSANHRIKKHQVDGTYLSEFGSSGTGNTNFSYPHGIYFDGADLYISDKNNHRIKKQTITGTYLSEFGSFGTGNSNLKFPENVTIINSQIVVTDPGNEKIKYFNLSGLYLSQIPAFTFNYPVNVINANDQIIIVIDRQDNAIYNFDDVGTEINNYGSLGTGNDNFTLPNYAAYDATNEKLYIVDQGNHRIKIVDFLIVDDVPIFADDILKLTKQLYPTGRAWWMKLTGIFSKFHEGLAYSESRAHEQAQNILNAILPDNDDFDETDAANWESALGLISNAALSLSVRKTAIERKMQHPGDIPARQHYLYLQGQLRAAGFDVYVHENRVETSPGSGVYELLEENFTETFYGAFNYGADVYGNSGLGGSPIANYIEESKDVGFNFGNAINKRSTFFIGGQVFPNFANVDALRKNEFRELILKIKPASTAGLLLINYI